MFIVNKCKEWFGSTVESKTKQNNQQKQNSPSYIKKFLFTALKIGVTTVGIITIMYLGYKRAQNGLNTNEMGKFSDSSDDNLNLPLSELAALNEYDFNENDFYKNNDEEDFEDFLQYSDPDLLDSTSEILSSFAKTKVEDLPEISYRRVPPVFLKNELTISEGQIVVLNQNMLESSLGSCEDPWQVQLSVNSVQHGQFERVSNPGVPIITFTQQDINTNSIQFRHNGGELAPSYNVESECTTNGEKTGYQPAAITYTNVNDVPTLVNNQFTINENGTVVLDGTMISAADVDNNDNSLIFTADVQYGFAARTSAPQIPITTFTQQEIINREIQVKHDGTENPITCRIKVGDGTAETDYQDTTITFNHVNDAPKMGNNQFTINEGGTVTLDETMISVIDPDSNSTSIIFTADIQHGFFNRISDPTTPITTFTREEIINGKIQVTHGGTENPIICRIKASDGEFETDYEETSITFNHENDMPQFESNEPIKIDRGGEVILTPNMLNATDPDNNSTEVRFLIKSLLHGNFERTDQPGSISSFSLRDIEENKVKLVHDGSVYPPTFTFSITDGENETENYQANIDFHDPGDTNDTNVDDDTYDTADDTDDTIVDIPTPSFPSESIIIGGIAGGACIIITAGATFIIIAGGVIVIKNKKDKAFRESQKEIELFGGDLTKSFEKELQIPFKKDIKVIKHIGSGAAGSVFLAEWEDQDVACKLFKINNEEEIDSFKQEATLLFKLLHPNIVRIFGVSVKTNRIAIIMEYASEGSLQNVLRTMELSRLMRWGISYDISKGLNFLHKKNVLHRDLKSANILIFKEGEQLRAKLTDFGLSKQQTIENQTATCAMGTYQWMAPELGVDEKPVCNKSCDIYGLGIVFWEILTREKPFSTITNTMVIPMRVRDSGGPEFWLKIPKESPPLYADLMRCCWNVEGDQRPSAQEVVDHLETHKNEIINYQSTLEQSESMVRTRNTITM